MLVHRVAVGHAGHVIGDGAGKVGLGAGLELRGKEAGVCEEGLEQFANDAACAWRSFRNCSGVIAIGWSVVEEVLSQKCINHEENTNSASAFVA